MDIMSIVYSVIGIGSLGLIFGVGLGIAAKKFHVAVDDRVEQVKENLPGANCGGCGFAGCEAFADAIVNSGAKITNCGVCNASQIDAIAKIMGVEADVSEKQIAFVRCQGNNAYAKTKYNYEGIKTCKDAHLVNGGPKTCKYGCLGYGDCENVCQFGAIEIVDGLAVINNEKCTGCGTCSHACPRSIIKMIPQSSTYHVKCISLDKGKEVKASCSIGCIGCGLCVKQCEVGAIKLENNLAEIDPEKCVGCGKCKDKCPTKAIILKSV